MRAPWIWLKPWNWRRLRLRDGGVFIFIGGIQPKQKELEGPARLCPSCGIASCRRMRRDQYLSLFFIPLFPVKKGQEFWACTRCGGICSGPEAARAYTTSRHTQQDKPDSCPACGSKVRAGYVYCPQCGRRL